MDPSETLARFRDLMLEASRRGVSLREQAHLKSQAADLMEHLDQWLSDGGFLPGAWAR